MLKKFKKKYKKFLKTIKKNRHIRSTRKYVRTKRFAKRYLKVSIFILFISTLYWAFLGAKIQLSNADQLVNPMFFETPETFRDALIPTAHTFLLKWPVFLLIKAAGLSASAYIASTIILVLATVGIFARILYKIENRPLQIGSIYLGLSSVLMLVPTVSYSGALLPVNMAMVTTRNIEYVLYVVALIFVVRARNKISSKNAWAAALLLAILFASDNLFISVNFAAAVFLLAIYSLAKKWDFAKIWLRWLTISVVGLVLGIVIILGITEFGITNIVTNSSLSPYSIVGNAKDLAIGTTYAALGVLTNFGANPAYDATVLKDIPSHAIKRIISPSGPAYIINLAFLLVMIVYGAWLLRASFIKKPLKAKSPRFSISLTIMLITVSLASIGSYIFTNHYYPADSRYLGIIFFTAFVSLATFSSTKKWKPLPLSIIGLVFAISIALGAFGSFKIYHQDASALKQTDGRNYLVGQALVSHKVNVLVGDYWRVVPTKFVTKTDITIAPLATCTGYRESLTSKQWQPDLRTTSFAYLLSLKKGLTDFPACTYEQVLQAYGRPSSSALIAGTFDDPEEILLFFDNGTHNLNAHQSMAGQKDTLSAIPVPLDTITNNACQGIPTTMQIVAHEDDDLLFMSPDLLHDINDKKCIKTVYVTAGDSGSNDYYWLKREQGSEAAYTHMLGAKEGWTQKTVKLPGGQFASFLSPRGNPRVTLVFLHLPDGGLSGQGFAGYNQESIGRLQNGSLKNVKAVDGQSVYSRESLVKALSDIMNTFEPDTVKTQSALHGDNQITDHSDHNGVGMIATDAFNNYVKSPPTGIQPSLMYYLGYPARLLEPNVPDPELIQKTEAFIRYAEFDGAVCHSLTDCENTATYYGYLARQYTSPN